MICKYCGVDFSEEELSIDGYCSSCEECRCNSCGYPSDSLNGDGECEECEIEYGESMSEGRSDCHD